MLEQSAVDDMNVETARIDPLDWDGSGIRCGGVTMEGHEFLTSLQARNIETEFSRWELLKRAFVITSVNIAELKLQLAPVPFRFREKPEGARSWAEENILPDTFRLEKGSIDSLSVSYGEAGRPYVWTEPAWRAPMTPVPASTGLKCRGGGCSFLSRDARSFP